MTGIFFVFIFLLGLIIGSFLNVVIYRYNTGFGINGRSGCMTCGRVLSWYELIPVVSFIIQKGRCRGCNTKLSWQYPLVELLTAILFTATFFKYFYFSQVMNTPIVLSFCIMLIALSILVVIIVYDLRHKIIPDGLVYTFAALGLLKIILFVPVHHNPEFYVNLIAGPLLFLPFFILWLISQGRWIGLGDGKLALGIGWMLGIAYGISAIILAFWIGAAVSIVVLIVVQLKSKSKQLTMKSEIPFAPFLILGFLIVYFSPVDILGLTTLFSLLK